MTEKVYRLEGTVNVAFSINVAGENEKDVIGKYVAMFSNYGLNQVNVDVEAVDGWNYELTTEDFDIEVEHVVDAENFVEVDLK